MDLCSDDIVNQITLNCLISKSQLMKINNLKNKKNLDADRKIKINKYNSQLIKLFKNLLDGNEPSNLYDDVKYSYNTFIDKCIIYFDNNPIDDNPINNNTINSKDEEEIDNVLNSKVEDMMNRCYDDKYHEIKLLEEGVDEEEEEGQEDQEEDQSNSIFIEEDEDEDEEYR